MRQIPSRPPDLEKPTDFEKDAGNSVGAAFPVQPPTGGGCWNYGVAGRNFNAAWDWRRLALLLVAGLSLLLGISTATPAVAAEPAAAPLVVALGDSLTAGYGLPADQAFPSRLQARLAAEGIPVRMVNAGVSGDTTAGGRARLDWVLADKPAFVLLELGANDALRGLDPAAAEANLDAILAELKRRGIPVLLCGMLAPRNMGRDYTDAFDAIFPRLAKKYDVPLYPFFLAGVVGKPDLLQRDGKHPTAAGVEVIVGRILPYVKRLVAAGSGRGGT